jgi:hypothetical protein
MVAASPPWLRAASQQISALGERLDHARGRLALAVVLAVLSVGLHAYFLAHAGMSVDEPTYVEAGYIYAQDIHTGHADTILSSSYNMVHPALTKLLFAGAILIDWQVRGYAALPASEQYQQNQDPSTFHASATFARYLNDARLVIGLFGVLLVVLLALYSPIAAILALVSTIVLTYTSLAYLEAPGVLFSTLAVVLYLRGRGHGWSARGLMLAGIAVGLAGAAKYYYILPGALILGDWLVTAQEPLRRRLVFALLAGAVAVLAFSVADPIFWTQNLPAAITAFGKHGAAFSTTEGAVIQGGNPNFHFHWYSNLTNLAIGFRGWYAPGHSPFLLSIDLLIVLLGLLGALVTVRHYTFTTLWLVLSVLTLAVYPTKYAQYTELAIVPLCLSAATGADWLYRQYAMLAGEELRLRQSGPQPRPAVLGAYLRAVARFPVHIGALGLHAIDALCTDAQQLVITSPGRMRTWLGGIVSATGTQRARLGSSLGMHRRRTLVPSQAESDAKPQ